MPREREPDEGLQEQQMREQGWQRIHEHAAEMREHLHRSRRGKGRESRGRPPLSREQVVRAALAIVDRDGLDAFSMRKLGAELGVDPMAAYYYFPNKAAVLDGIVDAVQAEIVPLPDNDAPWDVRLRETMHAYRRVFRAHPHALPVLSTHPPSSLASLQHVEAAMAILHDAGFAPEEAFQVLNCIAGYVIGVTLAEVGLQPGGVSDPTAAEIVAYVAQLPASEFPLLTTVFRNEPPFDEDAKFEDGLDLLITGLKVRHDAFTRKTEEASCAHPTAAS